MSPEPLSPDTHPSVASDIAAQVSEIHSELDDLKSQRKVIETDLAGLQKLRAASSPSRGGTPLEPAKWAELQGHIAEDLGAIAKIKTRLAELNAELNRLVPGSKPDYRPGDAQLRGRNLPIEVRFMNQARAILAPEVFEAVLKAAQDLQSSGGGDATPHHRKGNRGGQHDGGYAANKGRQHRGHRGRR